VEQLPAEAARLYLVLAALLTGMAEVRSGRLAAARSHLVSLERRYNRTVNAEIAFGALHGIMPVIIFRITGCTGEHEPVHGKGEGAYTADSG